MPQRDRERLTPTQRRRARRQRRDSRQRIRRALSIIGLGTLGVVIIAGLALSDLPGLNRSPDTVADGPGTLMPDQGRDHFAAGERAPDGYYNTYPPTSGTHSETATGCGFMDQQVDDEAQVHNLEHGFVLVQYNTDDQAMIDDLKSVAEGLPGWPDYYIVAPYDKMDLPIALTAWRVLQFLDTVDASAIRTFVNTYLQQGPEQGAPGC